ncbi:MAG TPA: DUF2516 family protein [Jatrophihabitans sp.]|uniref:DUF2516 family protein n=1 Tax=Jatrophihabitans sp. TaxID=1932789 RepID=UPI002DF77D2B|nr:DUF2516 family protein [Jatrophihabitans sp.]
MDAVDQLYYWTDHVLYWALVALRVWALADCVSRKSAAFTAVNKLTKPAWVAILLIGGLLGTLFSSPLAPSAVVSVFSLISVVAAAVYLADVRPAVREISGGR